MLALGLIWCTVVGESALGRQPAYGGRQRRVAWFHFEERPRNPYELPEHWFAIGRKARTSNINFDRYPIHQQLINLSGFPRYTQVRFDQRHHVSGQHSFYLGLNGGSAGAFLELGTINAVENSDYLITAKLRTTSLRLARARLVGYFVDRAGNKIGTSESASGPIQTDGKWQTISIKLLGDFPQAAWIGMQIELRQRQYDTEDPLASHQVVFEEIHGGAWFDDIVIWQLPRLTVHSQSNVNIVRAPQKPRLSMQVLDLTGRPLTVDVTLYDHAMRPVISDRRPAGPGMPPRWHWQPDLEQFGWYLVDMRVYENSGDVRDGVSEEAVGRAVSSLLWLDEGLMLDPIDASRFGLIAEELSDHELNLIPDLMDQARLNAVVLSAWKRRLTLMQVEKYQADLDDVLQQLLSRRRKLTLSLYPLPDELARTIDTSVDSPITMFDKPIDKWRPFLAPVLMRHAQRVHRWQLGPTRQKLAFFDPNLPKRVQDAQTHLRNMAPQPQVVLPWNIHQARRRDVDEQAAYSMHIPPSVLANRLGDYLQGWTQSPRSDVALLLEVAPADRMAHARRIADLVLRMLHAWEADASSLHLQRPWTLSADRQKLMLPDPILGSFATVAHLLAGRQVVGRLPLSQGLRCMILDGRQGGMLAVWNRSAQPQDAQLDMFLGESPVAIDVWGNRTVLPQVDGRHQLKITDMPQFIVGIDPRLALFRAAFSIEPAFIESKQIMHQRTITIANPWRRTISGHMVITDPQTWMIQPRRTFFSIAAGQSTTVDVSLRFPISEVAGHKRLKARFDFVAEREYVADLSAPMELGLRDVEFDANLALETNPRTAKLDAIVTCIVTSRGETAMSLRAFAIMSGYPREMKPIIGLKSGQSVVRRFLFEDVGDKLDSTSIRVGLRELTGPAVLNQILSASDL